MIVYIEKGAGLHKAIEAAGHTMVQCDRVWVSSDDVAVQAIIDGYTIAQAQTAKCAEVIALATSKFDKAIESYSRGELSRWPTLRDEADAYAANPAAAVPRISSEAAVRGITVDALAAKVRSNAVQFDGLGDQIAGTSGKHRDAIGVLIDFASVAAYDFSTGWPAV